MFEAPQIEFGGHATDLCFNLRYLRMQIDNKLTFVEHIKKITDKALEIATIYKVMPNTNGLEQVKRKLTCTMRMHAQIVYSAPI